MASGLPIADVIAATLACLQHTPAAELARVPLSDIVDQVLELLQSRLPDTLVTNATTVSLPEPTGREAQELNTADARLATEDAEIGDIDDVEEAHEHHGGDTEADAKEQAEADDGSDACSISSETSTLQYEQEPFETFKDKVLVLAQKSIWPDATASDIEVERMAGGGYNRVIGLTLKHNFTKTADTKLVLRIPRFEEDNSKAAATFQFVSQHTDIPVPDVLHLDESTDNVIEAPYMAQARLVGNTLEKTWRHMSHEQKLKVVKELGSITHAMLFTRSPSGGSFILAAKEQGIDHRLRVTPLKFCDPLPWDDEMPIESCPAHVCTSASAKPAEPMAETLKRIFSDRIKVIQEHLPDEPLCWAELEGMIRLTAEFEDGAWFKDVNWCLNHLDFAFRNVLVDITGTSDAPLITGILDWDSAVLGPSFMTCKPPYWIWAWTDEECENRGDDEAEPTTYDEPEAVEKTELKKAFEEAAGEEYMRFAYHPAYRIARRLFRFVTDGLSQNEDSEAYETIAKEWGNAKTSWRSMA